MTCIRGADAVIQGKVAELEGFQLKSLTEFVIELEKPNHLFPLLLSHPTCGIVPEGQCLVDGTSARDKVPPVLGELVISEFMANPKKVDDTAGEWFEVFATADVLGLAPLLWAPAGLACSGDLVRKAGWLRGRPVDSVEGTVTALTRFRRYR